MYTHIHMCIHTANLPPAITDLLQTGNVDMVCALYACLCMCSMYVFVYM